MKTQDPSLEIGGETFLEIDGLNSQAEGIGRHDGLAVFVPGALPGERVRVRITKTASNYARGRLEQVERISPERSFPRCTHPVAPDENGSIPSLPFCGGCQLQILSRHEELVFKRSIVQENLERIGGLQVEVLPVVAGSPYGYRNKMAFALTLRDGHLSWGLRGLGDEASVVPIEQCEIAAPDLWNGARQVLETLDEAFGSDLVWDGKKGFVRGVMVRIHTGRTAPPTAPSDRASLDPSLVLVFAVTDQDTERAEKILASLKELPNVRAFFSFSDPRSTSVYYDRTRFLNRLAGRPPYWGEGVFREEIACWHTIGPWPTLVGPTSFLQVNDEIAQRLYRRVLELPFEGGGLAVDAYCGVGVLTRALADRFQEVVGIELDTQSIKLARTTARRLHDCRVEWIAEPTETVFSRWRGTTSGKDRRIPDLVVLDPPRKGCQKEVLRSLEELRPKDVVYVSCHPAALARDLKTLTRKTFEVVRVEPFDMFPQTYHVETLVHLKRS